MTALPESNPCTPAGAMTPLRLYVANVRDSAIRFSDGRRVTRDAAIAELNQLEAERQKVELEVASLCEAIRKLGYEPVKAYRNDGSSFTSLVAR